MGLLIDGEWHDRWYDTKSSGGRFERDRQAAVRAGEHRVRDAAHPAAANLRQLPSPRWAMPTATCVLLAFAAAPTYAEANDPSVTDLVQRASEGDQRAWEALVDRYNRG